MGVEVGAIPFLTDEEADGLLCEMAHAPGRFAEPSKEEAFALLNERAALRAAICALLDACGDWECVWMQHMKGYVTWDEYAALRTLGALVGRPDPHVVGEG